MSTEKAGATEDKVSTSMSGAQPQASGGKLVLILSLVNSVATLGMFGILFLSFQREKQHASVEDIAGRTAPGAEAEGEKGKEKEGKEAKEGKEGEAKSGEKKKFGDYGKMVTLEQFTINLSTPGSVNSKFVRVSISLEVLTDEIEAEITAKMPQIRNTIIDLFNSKRPSDLAGAEGRESLKEEIKNAINSFLVSGKVKGVYFTSFALAG